MGRVPELDLAKLSEVMVYPVIVDGRNFLDASHVTEAGFSYYSMGRRPVVLDHDPTRA